MLLFLQRDVKYSIYTLPDDSLYIYMYSINKNNMYIYIYVCIYIIYAYIYIYVYIYNLMFDPYIYISVEYSLHIDLRRGQGVRRAQPGAAAVPPGAADTACLGRENGDSSPIEASKIGDLW